jgi:hypothetical protein
LSARDALRRYGEPGLVAAALGAAYLLIQPDSADHAAQVFRSGLFANEGIVTWDNFCSVAITCPATGSSCRS